jgi:hypothetical protein
MTLRKPYVFILMGQSNMSGRGKATDVPALGHPDILMWRDGQWTVAKEPLHRDKPERCGIGLGMSFAVELVSKSDLAPIGLIPCAVGGSPLKRWMPGADLYEQAVAQARVGLKQGTLAGFLWHQGEHDSCFEEMADSYGERLAIMISSLRKELDATEIPFIAGELGPFLRAYSGTAHFNVVNRHLSELESSVTNYTCISAEDMTDNGDALHFNAKSLREFGIRYATAFRSRFLERALDEPSRRDRSA